MGLYVIRRLLSVIPLVIALSLATFVLIHQIGDPLSFYISSNVSGADVERLRAQFGLDRPLLVQYGAWLANILTGNWGNSLVTRRPVLELIAERFPATLLLMGTSYLVTLLVGVPLGVLAALRRNRPLDYVISLFSLIAYSAPTFWTGIMAIVVFSIEARKLDLPYLPSGGMYNLARGPSAGSILVHLILPVTVLSVFSLARYVRYMRSSMIDVLEQDYIRTARAKGLPASRVVVRHAVRNAILPIVTLMSVDLPRLMGGALITEQVFSWPGMGRLMIEHAMRADFPVLMGILVVIAVLVAIMSIVGDVLYTLVDPRIALG